MNDAYDIFLNVIKPGKIIDVYYVTKAYINIIGAELLTAIETGGYKSKANSFKKLFRIKKKYYTNSNFKERNNYLFEIDKEANNFLKNL